MTLNLVDCVGGAAAVLSTASFLPQVLKIIRTRDTTGISTKMYYITVAGFALWTAYGFMKLAWPIIASNVVCLALSTFILIMKLLPSDQRAEVAKKMG